METFLYNTRRILCLPVKRVPHRRRKRQKEKHQRIKYLMHRNARQHIRSLAVEAMRVVIEEVMREELEQCVGAQWGEITPERKGYRNGYYTRDVVTSPERIEDLSVPRDREGQFHTQVFERYGRYEPEIAARIDRHVYQRNKHP